MAFMYRSHRLWLVSLALTLVNFGLNAPNATAQTTYTFNANYDISATSRAIAPDISAASLWGESNDAPDDLTTINGLTYSMVDFTTGAYRLNTDPRTFNLQNATQGSIVFGSGQSKLFGTDNATGVIDFDTQTARATGTFTITGGEGMFTGATGTLGFSEIDRISLDPAVPTTAQSSVNGLIEIVPEPKSNVALFGMGIIAASVVLRRHRGMVQK